MFYFGLWLIFVLITVINYRKNRDEDVNVIKRKSNNSVAKNKPESSDARFQECKKHSFQLNETDEDVLFDIREYKKQYL